MQRLFKIIGVAALALAAVADASAQSIATISDRVICANALNRERSAWDQNHEFSKYVAEAVSRRLSITDCRQTLERLDSDHESEITESDHESEITDSGIREQSALLEAAAYFITGLDVDARKGDVVSDVQIEFGQYPIVIYFNKDQCTVRVRTTTEPYTVWQFDFCKITYWRSQTEYGFYSATWFGEYTAFCLYRGWDRNENYTGDISPINSRCSLDGQKHAANDLQNNYRVWNSLADINDLVDVRGKGRKFGGYSHRPVDRMIASFKYIVTLLTGKPY